MRPILVGGAVAVGTFVLAQAEVFTPSTPARGVVASGDVYVGEIVFQANCASCHGDRGMGGGVGPALFETGLDAIEVASAVEQGRGVMPAGIVTGQDQLDVAAYVASISSPSQ